MKTILTLSLIALLCSCGKLSKQRIIVTESTDTIKVEIKSKPVIEISKYEQDLINSFRKPLQDVAYYMLLHKNKYSITKYRFTCGKYQFWIANGYRWFKINEPIRMELLEIEKRYFWKIYKNYRDNEQRLYKWESDIEIIIK